MFKASLTVCLCLAWAVPLQGADTALPGPAEAAESTPAAGESAPLVQLQLPATEHPWARYPVGSWREVEITTETYDEAGKLFGQSLTTQQEILKVVAEDSYALEVQATVDVSGKRIVGPANTRILRLLTDRPGVIYSSVLQGEDEVQIGSQVFPCEVWEVEFNDESRNEKARLLHSAQRFPFVLRRELTTKDASSAGQGQENERSRIIALEVPFSFRDRTYSCVLQKTDRRNEKGSTQSLAMLSDEIPGGEIASWSTDLDTEGRRVRWSVLRLVSFEVTAGDASLPPPPATGAP